MLMFIWGTNGNSAHFITVVSSEILVSTSIDFGSITSLLDDDTNDDNNQQETTSTSSSIDDKFHFAVRTIGTVIVVVVCSTIVVIVIVGGRRRSSCKLRRECFAGRKGVRFWNIICIEGERK